MNKKINRTIVLLGVLLATALIVSSATAVQINNKINYKKTEVNSATKVSQKDNKKTENNYMEKLDYILSIFSKIDKIKELSDDPTLVDYLILVLAFGSAIACTVFSLTVGLLWSWPIFAILFMKQNEKLGYTSEPTPEMKRIMFMVYTLYGPAAAFIVGLGAVVLFFYP